MPRVLVPFVNLELRGIPYCREHINELMRRGLFPPAVRVGLNRIAWWSDDLDVFMATRPMRGEPLPLLWPIRDRPKPAVGLGADTGKRRGRPRGSKVIIGSDGRRRLVRPELPAAVTVRHDAE